MTGGQEVRMDINEKLMGLETVTGIPVYPDEVPEGNETGICFTYEDERPVLYGDDRPLADTAYIQINMYTSARLNYMNLKHKLRNYLEAEGFRVTSIASWIEKELTETERTRHTTFDVNYTKPREKEE